MTELASAIRAAAPPGARISFVSGNFNIVHPGHLRLLKLAADTADFLVVGLTPDTASGVTMPVAMRLEGVRALSIVKHAFVMEGTVEDVIADLRPDFVVKGKEFEGVDNPEATAIEAYGGRLIFSSGDVQFASMDLLRREIAEPVAPPLLRSTGGFQTRHGLTKQALHDLLGRMSKLRVAVIGDIIVDDYVMCDPLGMSQEDPTIVVSPIETQTFVGGAGIVSAHARSLGGRATLFTVFGADETAAYAHEKLKTMGVDVHSIVDETRPTTRKQRFRALNKTLLRVNHLRQHAIGKQLADKLRDDVIAILPDIDLLMFSDFNYGCLPQELVDSIATEAQRLGVPMTADSQASSQMADIARFKNMALITPTEREARLALRDTASGIAVVATNLREVANAKNLIITLGEDGMMINGLSQGEYVIDRLPALNAAPKDVAGAGDSVFTSTSMALCAGADIWLACYLGGIAAALQVSRVGNTPLAVNDIQFEINQIDHT